MTIENWIMIAPVLFMLLVAVMLIPLLQRMQKKYAEMVVEDRRRRAKVEQHANEPNGASVIRCPHCSTVIYERVK